MLGARSDGNTPASEGRPEGDEPTRRPRRWWGTPSRPGRSGRRDLAGRAARDTRRRGGTSLATSLATALTAGLVVAGGAGLVAVPLAASGGPAGASTTPAPRVAVPQATSTPPSFTSGAQVTIANGTSQTITITASGSPLPTISQSGGTVPPGMTFSGPTGTGTATISGTPAATQSSYTVDLTASNGVGTATQTLTINLTGVNAAPAFTSSATAKLVAGQQATVHITASGNPLPTITAAGGWPPGMTFSASSGSGTATLSGVPQPTTSTYTVNLTASNGVAPDATQQLVITFSTAPAFTTPSTFYLTAGKYATVTIKASGSPAPTIQEYGALPPGMTFSGPTGTGTATITGTPQPGSTTTYNLTVTASNGVGTPVTQQVVLSFQSPVTFTSPATMSLKPGAFNNLTITTKSTPVAQLQVQGALPPGLQFRPNANGTASILGVLQPTSQTSWDLTITANNGQGNPATQHLVLVVPSPVSFTSPATQAVRAGAYNTIQVTTKGSPTPTLTESGTLPPGMVFHPDNTNGSATIAGYVQPGVTGTYGVTITATNGVAPPVVQHLELTFSQAPSFTTPSQLTAKDGTYVKFTIRANGLPPPTMTIQGTLPAGLRFYAGHGVAVIAGTPHYGLQGTSTVTIVASNGAGPNATQVLRITLVPVGPPANPRGNGYWYVTSAGTVVAKGHASVMATHSPNRPSGVVGMALTPDQRGYYLVTSYGGVFGYGDARFMGSIAHLRLRAPTVAIAVTPSGRGYYEVTRGGNVYAYGDAHFFGSTAGRGLPPIAAFALTPDGHGYWLVSIHGNIYQFGDARFFGSPARMRIPTVVGFAPTPDANGYWVVTRTGNVLTYGDAASYGDLSHRRIPPVSAFAVTKDGHGYWIVTTQGNVFNLGDARFFGSSAHLRLPGVVRGFAPMF